MRNVIMTVLLLHERKSELEQAWNVGGLRAQFMGTVQSVGTGVTHVAVGDRVVACFDIACGRCFHCKKARRDALQLKAACTLGVPARSSPPFPQGIALFALLWARRSWAPCQSPAPFPGAEGFCVPSVNAT